MITIITDIIVGASVLSALVFLAAWVARPDLRRRIEDPKHRFLSRLERYDRQCLDNRTDGTR